MSLKSSKIILFCISLFIVFAELLWSVPTATADYLSDELVKNNFGVWPDANLPIKYTIDDTFTKPEKAAIRSAFSTWEAAGSRILFQEVNYDGQTLKIPTDIPDTDVVLVTKQYYAQLPIVLDSKGKPIFKECDRGRGIPFIRIENRQIIGGVIVLYAEPRTDGCSRLYWSTLKILITGINMDVESAMLHEIGHVIGLPHPENLEAPTILGKIASSAIHRDLFQADIDAIRLLYGTPTISQSVDSGPPGTTFVQSGSGFTPYHQATVYFQKDGSADYSTETQTIASNGKFFINYQSPLSKEPGIYNWWARDDGAGIESQHLKYIIDPAIPLETGGVYGRLHSTSDSGAPLQGVRITCSGQSTITGADGGFYVVGVSSGNQEITFTKTGYQPYTRAIYVIPGTDTDIGDRWLVPSVVIPPPPAGTPDLAVHGLTIHKKGGNSTRTLRLAPGEPFVIDVEVINRGSVNATKQFAINYLLSDDDRIEAGDQTIGTDSVKTDVKAGKVYKDTKQSGIKAPSTTGTYYIGASVSSPQDVNKLNDFSRGDDERAKIIVSMPNRIPEGWLDAAECDVISGWARDSDTTSAVQVHIYSDGPAGTGTFQGAATAGILRTDLPFTDKYHGFALPTPFALKNGQSHTIYAYGIDSAGGENPLLSGSPKSIKCSRPPSKSVVSAGSYNTFVSKDDGTVWAWGYNVHGEIGDGTTTDRLTPVPVQVLTNPVDINAFYTHNFAIKDDGTVWAWGHNFYGEIGDGTTTDRLTPVQVPWLAGAVAVDVGQIHTVAIKDDGTVWTFGGNWFGQLGDGTTTDRFTPVQVPWLAGAVAVSASYTHNLAINGDGTAWAWGRNDYGQLGDGTKIDRLTPVQLPGLTGMVAVSAGAFHGIGLKDDGTVWTWGSNDFYQLGIGSQVEQLTPVQVPGLAGVVAVSAGDLHNVVLKDDGTVWTWGPNYGGDTVPSMPVQVPGLTGMDAISAGASHTAAIKGDGTVWTWGGNYFGQLGDGTTTERATPMQVSGFPPSPPSSLPGYIFFTSPLGMVNGGVWASSPITMGVGCLNGTSIYFTMVNTYDGSTPADPREPTSSDNDGSVYDVVEYVDGSGISGKVRGFLDLYANAGQYKRGKLRFRCYNSAGVGIDTPTGPWSYNINLRDLPGDISLNPSSGSWTSSPKNLVVSSSYATTIYYTMVNTYDGSTPADPREPTFSDNDGSISVPGGRLTFQGDLGLYATAGQYKMSKLRFRAYNSAGAGPASGVYSYSIDLR